MTELSPLATRFDHRVPSALRPFWLGLKWSLAGLGAYLLIGNYVMKWGWPATIWFMAAPFAWGVWQGITALRHPDSASPLPPH